MEYRRTQIRWATGIASILLASLGIFLPACIDSGTGPTYKPQVGLTGVVVDTSGKALDGVTVHCLFSQWSVPSGTAGGMTLNRISGVDTFAFRLYQNIPNPFSHSTFLRFALPKDAAIRLSITDRLGGSVLYTLVDNLSGGLYQVYLYRLVDSLQLKNGPYDCKLEASVTGNVQYAASVEIFVISDSGAASTTTDRRGWYLFDYEEAFVGDSVQRTSDGASVYTEYLTNNVILLFQRRGYWPARVQAALFPNLLLTRDVVLFRMN